ncbi:MAG TPA: GAF and ANTAR domain-containing protein [Actinomycetota bacterium]|nr:GAF and ANTAR domain-containing protein [Actinomycetota bacterium]
MPIDPSMLAKSIATLTDLDPERDLAATLDQAVVAAKQLFAVDAAGIMLADADGKLRWASASDLLAQTLEDNQETFAAGPCLEAFTTGRPAVMREATLEPRWGEITLAFVELQIRSGLSVPVELGGGPIGTLDVYNAAPGGWDETEVSALQTYAGLVATLLGAAAKAEISGRLADQLQVARDYRMLTEQAKSALIDRERLDDQEAFIDLQRAVRSFRRELPDVAAGLPMPRGPAEPAERGAHQLDLGALDGEAAAFLEQRPGADGVGHKLSQLLLGFLTTEVGPLANRLAELGMDPTPLFATTSGILRLYADTLEHPNPRR